MSSSCIRVYVHNQCFFFLRFANLCVLVGDKSFPAYFDDLVLPSPLSSPLEVNSGDKLIFQCPNGSFSNLWYQVCVCVCARVCACVHM